MQSHNGEKIISICEWGTYLACFLMLYGQGLPIITVSSVYSWNYNTKWARMWVIPWINTFINQNNKWVVQVHNPVQKDKKKKKNGWKSKNSW